MDRYKVVRASSDYELRNAVNLWMERGWKPQGGVAFLETGGLSLREVWVQAMVKPPRREHPLEGAGPL